MVCVYYTTNPKIIKYLDFYSYGGMVTVYHVIDADFYTDLDGMISRVDGMSDTQSYLSQLDIDPVEYTEFDKGIPEYMKQFGYKTVVSDTGTICDEVYTCVVLFSKDLSVIEHMDRYPEFTHIDSAHSIFQVNYQRFHDHISAYGEKHMEMLHNL